MSYRAVLWDLDGTLTIKKINSAVPLGPTKIDSVYWPAVGIFICYVLSDARTNGFLCC